MLKENSNYYKHAFICSQLASIEDIYVLEFVHSFAKNNIEIYNIDIKSEVQVA